MPTDWRKCLDRGAHERGARAMVVRVCFVGISSKWTNKGTIVEIIGTDFAQGCARHRTGQTI